MSMIRYAVPAATLAALVAWTAPPVSERFGPFDAGTTPLLQRGQGS